MTSHQVSKIASFAGDNFNFRIEVPREKVLFGGGGEGTGGFSEHGFCVGNNCWDVGLDFDSENASWQKVGGAKKPFQSFPCAALCVERSEAAEVP